MSEKWKCPNCGTENAADDNFCGECGDKKPNVGIGRAQTVKKQEEVVIPHTSVEGLESDKPKKKGVGKIAVIVVAICVVLIVCGVVINAQNKAEIAEQQRKIAEQQRIEAEERARIVEEERKAKEAEAKVRAAQEAAEAKVKAAQADAEAKVRAAQADAEAKLKATKKAQTGGGTKIGSLYWSKRSRNEMNWNAAVKYCQNLNEGGYSDWRLPTISELRTTIKNCSGSQSGGSCRVSDNCLGSNCRSPSCYCEDRQNNGGYYSKLGDDDKVVLWSSSVRSGNPSSRWLVHFNYGSVYSNGVENSYYVRCVR